MGLFDWVPFIGTKKVSPKRLNPLSTFDGLKETGEAVIKEMKHKRRESLDLIQRMRIVSRDLDNLLDEEKSDSQEVIKYVRELIKKLSGADRFETMKYIRKARLKKDEKKIFYGMKREHKVLEKFEDRKKTLQQYIDACAALIREANDLVDDMNAEIKRTEFWYKRRNKIFLEKSEYVAMRVAFQRAVRNAMPIFDEVVALQGETKKVDDNIKRIEQLESNSKGTLKSVILRLQEEKKEALNALIEKKRGKLSKGRLKTEIRKIKTDKDLGKEYDKKISTRIWEENAAHVIPLLKSIIASEEGIMVEEGKISDHMKKIMALVRLEYLEERKAKPRAP
ncbi:hypothetical protein KY312_02435 [Candidatus Woesearchaeota archaeon]|nr:hypothetical protein [Candidatus Woesearchaeota archaeon]